MLNKLTKVEQTINRLAKAGEDPTAVLEALDGACAGIMQLADAIREAGAVPENAAEVLHQWAAALAQLSAQFPAEAPEMPGEEMEMSADEFLAYAVGELEATAAEPAVAKRAVRLLALRKSVKLAKEAFVDTMSERVSVKVWQEPGTIAGPTDATVKSPVDQATGAAYAANPADVLKRLGEVQLVTKAAEVAAPWPTDVNSTDFRAGRARQDWGRDPA